MKILIFMPYRRPYDSQTVRQEPCGGTEKTATFLGEAFQRLGHTVHWVTTLEGAEASLTFEPDVVIAQQAKFLEVFPQARRIWWTHNFSNQPITQLQLDPARKFAQRVVTLSQAQHDDFLRELQIDSTVIGHGIWPEEILWPEAVTGIQKDPYRLLYCSAPHRGLDLIPKLFPTLKDREPRLTLSICSSMKTYGRPERDQKYEDLFAELGAMAGIELTGSLNQAGLYREMAHAGFLFYPCTFDETYCLSLDESLAHGCLPLVMEIDCKGALSERIRVFKPTEFNTLSALISTPPPRESLVHWTPRSWLDIARDWESQVFS